MHFQMYYGCSELVCFNSPYCFVHTKYKNKLRLVAQKIQFLYTWDRTVCKRCFLVALKKTLAYASAV